MGIAFHGRWFDRKAYSFRITTTPTVYLLLCPEPSHGVLTCPDQQLKPAEVVKKATRPVAVYVRVTNHA